MVKVEPQYEFHEINEMVPVRDVVPVKQAVPVDQVVPVQLQQTVAVEPQYQFHEVNEMLPVHDVVPVQQAISVEQIVPVGQMAPQPLETIVSQPQINGTGIPQVSQIIPGSNIQGTTDLTFI